MFCTGASSGSSSSVPIRAVVGGVVGGVAVLAAVGGPAAWLYVRAKRRRDAPQPYIAKPSTPVPCAQSLPSTGGCEEP